MKVRWFLGSLTISTALVQLASAAPQRASQVLSGSPLESHVLARTTTLRAGQFGGFGGGQEDVPLTAQFDADGNGRLDSTERRAARQHAETMGLNRGRGRRGGVPASTSPGASVTPASVRPFPSTPFFDARTVRTLFLQFENDEWEAELMAFKPTDVEVPATLAVDGRTYGDVGIQFRGNSSFSGVPVGLKHSISVNVDWIHGTQHVYGYNNLMLLNAHEDPSLLRTVLFMQIARSYIPAPQANFVRVVINGEDWGVYVNQQHFNKALLDDAFGTDGGTRWKVPGSPGRGSGGLVYLGDDPAAYRRAFEIKSSDRLEAWAALVRLTRVLNQTPPEALEQAISPLLDVDATLRFLALDNALANSDGYWTRASDYSLYLHPDGRFRLLPYDVNSTFPRGGGFGRGGRGGSPDLDPMHAVNDPSKPLISKLLAVPSLRAKYLAYVRDIAETWLDWNRLGPIVEAHHALIAPLVEIDQKKLASYGEFERSVAELKTFADRRRAVLLAATDSASTP